MKTIYAASKTISVPTITTTSGGSIDADTYYFWVVKRNRAGYTSPSPVKSLVVGASGSITIDASNFNTLSYEDIKETLISVSTTNDYATSRIIYKFNHFAADYITPITPANVVITSNATLNSPTSYNNPADISALTGLLTGFRVLLNGNGFCYEFEVGSVAAVDNVTVLNHVSGRWFKTRAGTTSSTPAS
jgi:hypothetical protein